MTTLKHFFEVYRPKAPDEQKFVDKHVAIKHKDRNGNGDDVFKGNTKYIKRKEERHGYDVGEDEKVYEEVEDLEELSRATISRYSQKAKSIADNEGGKDRTKGRELAGRKNWGGTMKGVEKARVPSTNEEVELDETNRENKIKKNMFTGKLGKDRARAKGSAFYSDAKREGRKVLQGTAKKLRNEEVETDVETLEEGTMRLSKVHIVHHHDHPAAKEFAKHYTDAMKGDHREGGPTEKDEAAANKFHERYTGVRTREGFAGSGTHIYTDHKTGAKWKVDRHPNGKTFYGTDHIISHHTGNIHEGLEEGEYIDTSAEDRVLRSLVAYYEELGEEVLIEDVATIAEELIAELSVKTLDSYRTKARQDLIDADANDDNRLYNKRAKGYRAASKSVSKKFAKEEVEQLDELSSKTLGSYVSKAARSAGSNIAGAVASGMANGNKDDQRSMGRNYAKRLKGIDTAAKKLTKEDVINRTITKYVPEDVELPSMEERLVAKLQDRISESHIETLLDLFYDLTEENQIAMLDIVETQEGINGLIDFALENRGE